MLVRIQWSVSTETPNDGGLNRMEDRVSVTQQSRCKESSVAKAVAWARKSGSVGLSLLLCRPHLEGPL